MDKARKSSGGQPFSGGFRAFLGDWRAFLGMFRMRLIGGMQYRAAAWAGIATQFFWGFVRLSVLLAFFDGASADPGMTYGQLASYIWLQQATIALLLMWNQDNDLLLSIQDGTVAYEFCRPVGLYGFWFARLLGARLASLALRVAPITVIAFLLPAPYGLALPPSLGAAALFAASLSLSALLVTAYSMFVYILTFVTLSSRGGILTLFAAGVIFLSGATIPIPLMPDGLRRVLELLPFRYLSDFPLRLYSGHIAGIEAAQGFAVQLAWLLALVALGAWALGRVQKRLIVQGG